MNAVMSKIKPIINTVISDVKTAYFPDRAQHNKRSPLACQNGFTLLEVMVALAILAVVAVTASQASRSYLNAVANVKTRTLAHYVAQNTLADLRINQTWITQPETRQVQESGRQWQVTITPTAMPTPENSTVMNMFRPISIAVAPVSETGVQNSISTLTAVISKSGENSP